MTPQDLDAAVHRATGNEYPDICSGMQRDDNGDCPYCGAYKPGDGKHSIPIPAYSTDPREWAPLLEELLMAEYQLDLTNTGSIYGPVFDINLNDGYGCGSSLASNKNLGVAVCEAYLKYKEGK